MKLSEAMRLGARATVYGIGNYMSAHPRGEKFECCALGAAMYHKLATEAGKPPSAPEVRMRAGDLALRLNHRKDGVALVDHVGAPQIKAIAEVATEFALGAAILTLNDQADRWCTEGDPRVAIADALEKMGL